jgi:uncharacterized membrane protein YsdA (DUF1294 family)/cold shock CspA family protein
MRYQGKIRNWKDDKGFGFVTPNGGGNQVFVHIKSFVNRQGRPCDNDIVTYELETDDQGRAQAKSVKFVGEPNLAIEKSGGGNYSIFWTAGFLAFVAASVLAGKLPAAILGLYLAASAVAFIAYALDKSAATNNRWRTSESTLHLFAIAGGWPGALAAQRLIHHKTKKQSFQVVFWATVIANCGALAWLFSPSGASMLHSIFS